MHKVPVDDSFSGASATDLSHCSVDDYIALCNAVRMFAVGCVMAQRIYRTYYILPEDRRKSVVRGVWHAGWKFAVSEGLNVVVYFGMAVMLHGTIELLAPDSVHYCIADKLVAMYTVALLTFLPNAIYALALQPYLVGRYGPVLFAVGAAVLAALSFYIKLCLVFDTGFIDTVVGLTATWTPIHRMMLATVIPTLVDLVASCVLIGVTHISGALHPKVEDEDPEVEDEGYKHLGN